MVMVYTIWQGMFGNGARIGMMTLKNTKRCVEGLGLIMLIFYMLLLATATHLVIEIMTADFAVR